jgi:hypothetical protein
MFKAPNFICRVKEKDSSTRTPTKRLVYADSADAAKTFLEGKDYEVSSVAPYNFDLEWKNETEEARANAQQHHGDRGFEFPSLWSMLKEHLKDVFGNRCAYCDGAYQAFGYGDVEHYRPKGKVIEDPNHPGYWWLAYDPNNYLPSCQLCNQKAKKNHFPIAGVRAQSPADPLEREEPLLLRPDQDRWQEHVRFRPSLDSEKPAFAEELTPKGKESIQVLELNRPELREARLNEQQRARGDYMTAMTVLISTMDNRILESVVERYQSRKRPFHAAGMDEINWYAAKLGLPQPFSRNGH